MTGPLEKTNSAYAVAKIAGVEMCHAYNRQHATKYLCAMPTNLYGPGDNFDLQTSHVLPAMIRKFHDAKTSGGPVVLWGSGSPRREFLHVDDLADACLHLMSLPSERLATIFSQDAPPLVNIGCGEDLTIRNLATLVAKAVGYDGEVSGIVRSRMARPGNCSISSRINGLGWKPHISLSAPVFATPIAGFNPKKGTQRVIPHSGRNRCAHRACKEALAVAYSLPISPESSLLGSI